MMFFGETPASVIVMRFVSTGGDGEALSPQEASPRNKMHGMMRRRPCRIDMLR
jgi:hypothetical protein